MIIKGELKALRPDEALLEFAYTFEKFRGQGVIAAAMATIAEQGLGAGDGCGGDRRPRALRPTTATAA